MIQAANKQPDIRECPDADIIPVGDMPTPTISSGLVSSPGDADSPVPSDDIGTLSAVGERPISAPLPQKRRAVAQPCRMLNDPEHRAGVLRQARGQQPSPLEGTDTEDDLDVH